MLTRRQACSALGALAALPLVSCSSLARAAAPPSTERAFLDAVVAGELGRVRELLAADASLARATDERGRSAFVLAHLHGRTEVAAHLLEQGLELDLVEAVLTEDWSLFEALAASRPAALHAAHPIGGTPLYAAALVGSLDFWRLRYAGCRPDAAPAGGTGFTPVRGAMESARSGWARISLADLCGNGADVNAPQRGGSSVLHGAVARRDATLVRLAVRKGADVAARDDAGRTPLALARELGWNQGAELLANPAALPRDNRSSRFARDANGDPIVRPDLSDVPQEAQSEVTGNSHGNLERVRELVTRDRRLVFSISTDDELAIEASAHMGNADLMRLHLDHGAPLSLPTAVSLGDRDSVRRLLRGDPTLIHERGAHDFPVMWYVALGRGGPDMGELLLEHGASIDQDSKGTTALAWCVRRGNRDLAAWFLERGADPSAVGFNWNRDGETPLELARRIEDAELAQLLVAAG